MGGSRRDPGESPEKHCYSRKDQRQGHCDEGKGEVVLEARGQVPGKRHGLLCPRSHRAEDQTREGT